MRSHRSWTWAIYSSVVMRSKAVVLMPPAYLAAVDEGEVEPSSEAPEHVGETSLARGGL